MSLAPRISFNDVYRVHQKYAIDPSDGTARYISAAQFARQLDDERAQWADSPGEPGGKEGLVLFSGGASLVSPSRARGFS